jgi:hypothetical protein
MGESIYFMLGSHRHLPWGSGDDEFEELYRRDLKPLCTALYKFPRISMTLHYSGVLLQWVEQRHPGFILLLRDLVSRRQVEFLGGGFYDPLFPLLPLPDKIGQIELFTTYLRRQFGKRPGGCWLPALAWEQSLAGPLNTCGMGYTVLDERAFAAAGGDGPGEAGYAPCITEDQGKIVTVFPLFRWLEEALEREPLARVLESLAARLPAGGEHIVTVFPRRFRAERGEAPESFFQQLFEDLSHSPPRFEFSLPGRVFRGLKNSGKLYFPSSIGRGAAYGHLPRQALTSHPEAKGIYSKMMFTHLLINQLRGDKARKRTAREELWKSQGGDLFYAPENFRGIPGEGLPLYRHPLRKAAYRSLLEAEKASREKGNFSPSLSGFDFDFDGQPEYLFQGNPLNCYIGTAGAAIFELDYLPRSWNYLDTFSPPGESGRRRTAFADYLFPPASASEAAGGGRFCGAERFEAAAMDRAQGTVRFRLSPRPELPFGMVELQKTYCLKRDALTAEYVLYNRGSDPLEFTLVPRLDFSFAGGDEDSLRVFKRPGGDPPAQDGSFGDAEVLELQDLKNGVLLSFSANRSFQGRILPVCAGEDGGYQSTCLSPQFFLGLKAGESWTAEFRLRLSPLRRTRH